MIFLEKFTKTTLVFIILFFTIVVDLFFYTGVYASDDGTYLGGLEFFYHASANHNIASLRYGVTIPTAFIYYITGKSLLAVYGLLMLMHVAMTCFVYMFTLKLKDVSYALAVAILSALTPIFYIYAGAFFPDLFQTLYLFIAFYLSWKGLTKEKYKVVFILLSGFVFGLSYVTKVSSVIMFVPFFLMYLEYFKFNIKDLIKYFFLFCLGFMTLVSIEVVINMLLLNEPFPRFTIVHGAKDLYLKKMAINGVLPLDRLETVWHKLTQLYPVSYLIVLLIGFISALFSKLPYKLTLFIFALWPFLYLTFGSTSLSQYLPPSIQARYYTLMMPWFIILSGVGLVTLIQKIKILSVRKVFIVVVFVLLPLSSVVYNHEKAGLLYRAAQVQTFEKSVLYVKKNYPNYDIVLNSYLTRRMQHVPVVNDESIKRLTAVLEGNKKFIYIIPLQNLPAQSDKNHLESKLTDEEYKNIEILKVIYPKTRFTNKIVQKPRGMKIVLVGIDKKESSE